MSEQQYVRHISGQGATWLVKDWPDYLANPNLDWCVQREGWGRLYLPKSEYALVSPPERWQDVSGDCETFDDDGVNGLTHANLSRFQTTKWSHESYRLRKVQLRHNLDNTPQWAFLVERRQP